MANPYGRAGKPKDEAVMTEPQATGNDADVAISVAETPEFQMELARAKAEIHDSLLAEVKAMMESKGPSLPVNEDSTQAMARAIATSIAEVADQGTNRKRVAPEILEARGKADKRMRELVEAAPALPDGKRPVYRVRSKAYFGDRLIEPYQRLDNNKTVPTHIEFTGIPNLALEPVNQTAKDIYAAFEGTMSGGDRQVNGRTGPDSLGAKAVWMTSKAHIISAPTVTAQHHDMVMDPEPFSVDQPRRGVPDVGDGRGRNDATVLKSVDDPRAELIPVLGTIAAPARRTTTSPRTA